MERFYINVSVFLDLVEEMQVQTKTKKMGLKEQENGFKINVPFAFSYYLYTLGNHCLCQRKNDFIDIAKIVY